jgi:hypothetical protein
MDKSGSAFPEPYDYGQIAGKEVQFRNYYGRPLGGLTKRELFAGLAMAWTLFDACRGKEHIILYDRIAEHAVRQADALLAELAKGEGA